jgi:ribosomal protein S18 acetylase RimI-like enzyme
MVPILALALFALLLARALQAPPGTWRWIVGAAALALVASQLLPAGHPYRVDLAGSARLALWIGLAAVPVAAYALWLRGLRRRSGVAAAPERPRPRGLVQFAEDAALAAETAAALEAEAPGRRLSLGWRGADGGLEGHLRLRVAGELAEVEQLRVAPAARRRGVGRALLGAAEGEAAGLGARRIGAAVADWQAPEFFAAAGYAPGPAAGARRWMEKAL